MSELPPGLPEGAEIASTGGFNRYVGPLYRLPDGRGRRAQAFRLYCRGKAHEFGRHACMAACS